MPQQQQPQFNPESNPFEGIMSQMGPMNQSQGRPQQAPQAPQQPMAQIPGSRQQAVAQAMVPDQLQPGKEGTGAKFILGAIQNLQGYIQMSTDPQKIRMLRQLVTVFVNLLSQEEEGAMSELGDEGSEEEMGEAPQQGGMMGGMGGGMQ